MELLVSSGFFYSCADAGTPEQLFIQINILHFGKMIVIEYTTADSHFLGITCPSGAWGNRMRFSPIFTAKA
jgi:hypothetical protein